MSEKMSINIEVLGINSTLNYIVPDDMSIIKLTDLILKTLKEEYPGVGSTDGEKHILLQLSTGYAMVGDVGLKELGIVNGERLIML